MASLCYMSMLEDFFDFYLTPIQISQILSYVEEFLFLVIKNSSGLIICLLFSDKILG